MNYINAYLAAIESGKIKAGKRLIKVYKRLKAEAERTDEAFPYYFDEAAGERPIEFIETFCKQSQGVIGERLELGLFQKAFIQALFGWKKKKDGFRRFREALFLVARKNGKSTLLSGIALYLLVADEEGAAEIYTVATKKDQAKKVLTEAINMINQSPELRALLKKRRNDVYFPMTASKFEALASDSNTLDGLNSHGVIIDELHAIRDRNLYEVMKQSMTARRQPLLVMITTAGTVRACIFDDMYEYAAQVADGDIKDDNFLPILYELDSRDEWLDPACWQKANPGLGTIKSEEQLAAAVERAKANPADVPGVLCKDFNHRENESRSWMSYDEIYNPATFEMQEVVDTYAIGGCDLSATTDLTAATLMIRKKDDPIVYVLQHYFLPKRRINTLDGTKDKEAPYKLWAERGLMTICEGARVNFSDVTEWFIQMREQYKIDAFKIGFDRALAGYWVEEMKQNGFDMLPVAQGPFTWSQPMREMQAALIEKKVNYNANPMLVWCLTNTAVKKSGVNNIQPIKITDKRRIDGAVSLLNAWVVYVRFYDDFMYLVG